MAWPQTGPGKRQGRPKIGMARLPRPPDWPLLRSWTRGVELPREPTYTPAASNRELEILGEQVFLTYCAACHGRTGRGDGPNAKRLATRPRDYSRGAFRFRSTPSGEPPTAADLFRTVTGGLLGTPMMAFADLPEEQRWGVVQHVRTLSPVFARPRVAAPLILPQTPADLDTTASRSSGRDTYARLRCGDCHGPNMRGDGPAAAALRDTEGRPLPVPDYSRKPYKYGSDAQLLYRSLVTGLDGTPMPSYAEAASPAELWSVVAFLREVRGVRGVRVGPATGAPAP